MVAVRLTGRITENGKLEVELPEGLHPGEVEITLRQETGEEPASDETPWTDEEIKEMMRVTPKTGAEIAAEIEAGLFGEGWSDLGITDGAEWVEEQRRKRREERNQW